MRSASTTAVRFFILIALPLLLQCRGFNWPVAAEKSAAAINPTVFSIVATSPADAEAGVATNTPIVVNFSESVNTGGLTFNAANGPCATTTLQVSVDNFVNCLALITPVWNGTQQQLSMTLPAALANSTTYQIRVTTGLAAASGRTLSAIFTTPTGFTTAAPGVLVPSMSSPVEGATGVAITAPLVVNFTYAVNIGTLSFNNSSGACTGSFQFSADNFVTCLALVTPAWTGGNKTLTINPSAPLNYSTPYQVRITTALTGASAEMLSSTYTSTGFTSAPPPALTVALTTPPDGATAVVTSTTFLLTFNYAVNIATVTYNASSGACTGSVQISQDNFATCIALNTPGWSGGNTLLTLPPATPLAPGGVYRVKVTTAVTGAVGNLLAADYTTASGVAALINAPAPLQVYTANAQNMLIWPPTPGAVSYNLYFSTTAGVTTGTGTLIASVSAPYMHTGLTNGTMYYYIVAGVNGGNLGTPSAQASGAPVASKLIFVTSSLYTGNLGGVAGADSQCATRASAASLSGQWRAYLSTATDDAACRVLGVAGKLSANCGLPVAPNLAAIGPYVNTGTMTVAASLQTLISNTLSSSVGYNETGSIAGVASPFTGTANGVFSAPNCGDWTDGSALSSATIGKVSATNSQWSSNGTGICSVVVTLVAIAPIYCVQY